MCVRKRPDRCVSFFWSCGSVSTEWLSSSLCFSVWIRSKPGVSLLWGLCEALWAELLVSGCMFPIGCFCLTKTQWGSGLLKEAVSLLVLALRKIICFVVITSYTIDETLLFWWDHLALMGPFCVINIWMESECQCYSLIHSTGTTLECEHRLSSLSMLFVGKRKVSQCLTASLIKLPFSMLCYGLTLICYMIIPIIMFAVCTVTVSACLLCCDYLRYFH